MFLTWVLTVFTEMQSGDPISTLDGRGGRTPEADMLADVQEPLAY